MPIDRTPGSKCAICGRLASDAHHYVFRSRGGTDDQTMPLCHDCHMDIHNERLRIDVDLLVTTAWLRVYSVAKTVADCFKHRNKIGLDVALEAPKDARVRSKASVDDIWRFAKICRVANVMRPYLESVG